jgi:hypothetical protein
MRRIAFVFASAACAAGLAVTAVTPALADSPHFLYANNTVSSTTGALTTSFKEVGLGTGTSSVTITVTVNNATALYQCFNNGGKHPQAGNKETTSSALSQSGTFPVRNGQTTNSLTVGPVGPGSFSCPSGQKLFLQSVTYSGITVSDAQGHSIAATPDPIGPVSLHLLIS